MYMSFETSSLNEIISRLFSGTIAALNGSAMFNSSSEISDYLSMCTFSINDKVWRSLPIEYDLSIPDNAQISLRHDPFIGLNHSDGLADIKLNKFSRLHKPTSSACRLI